VINDVSWWDTCCADSPLWTPTAGWPPLLPPWRHDERTLVQGQRRYRQRRPARLARRWVVAVSAVLYALAASAVFVAVASGLSRLFHGRSPKARAPAEQPKQPGSVCVYCRGRIARWDTTSAIEERHVRKQVGRVPKHVSPSVDADGNRSWLAHMDCIRPAEDEVAQRHDVRSGVTGRAFTGIFDAGPIASDPSLSPEQKAVAATLVQLGPSALGRHEAEVRAIGQRLHDAGGVPLMRAALHHADRLSRQRHGDSILRRVEVAWDGIGRWRG
jgi:hypothetical protein